MLCRIRISPAGIAIAYQMQQIIGISCCKDVIEKAFELKPDVILMDIQMDSDASGIYATREILAKLPIVIYLIFLFASIRLQIASTLV